MITFKGKTMHGSGIVSGNALVYREPLSFLGDVDGRTGIIRTINESLTGKVLIIPSSRGSTVGPYVMYQLSKYGKAPVAILSVNADTMLIIGSIMSNIPLITDLPKEILNLKSGIRVTVSLSTGEVYVHEP